MMIKSINPDAIDAKVSEMLSGWRTCASGEREIGAILGKTMALPANDNLRRRNSIAGAGLAVSAIAASLFLWISAPSPLPKDEPLLEASAAQILIGDSGAEQASAEEEMLP